MCTAITCNFEDTYFGRNLDIEYHFNENVVITPRNFTFRFRETKPLKNHYAIIGIATVADGFPLYYDGVNEYGLSMAGLSFPENAVYFAARADKLNVSPFEFIPFILSQCKTVSEARLLIEKINLADIPFSKKLPLSPLHWIISDKTESVTVESIRDGLHIYENPIGVLTNNPPFPYHLLNLNNYSSLSCRNPENTFSEKLNLCAFSRGMGAMGLPGDLSSQSRFVRAAFVKENSVSETDEFSAVNQFFHILTSVEQQRGCVKLENGSLEITYYSSCCNTAKGKYYYSTYENRSITCVDMHRENLDTEDLKCYPLKTVHTFFNQN